MKKMRVAGVACVVIAIGATGCSSSDGDGGSGGGGGGGGGATGDGVFKDGNVAGLGFMSGGESGVTDDDGGFTFEEGEPVAFSVGDVTIGTADPQSVLTPVDLVPGGGTGDPQVQNIARFLQMLDADGDLDNGIQISQAVQDAAVGWQQVDFTTTDLGTALQTIIDDVQMADGRAVALPSAGDAQAHLEETLRCVRAGAFTGTFDGDSTGVFGVLVSALFGDVTGFAVTNEDGELIELSGNTAVSLDQSATFITGITSDGATFEGRFDSPDTISGTWDDTVFAESGTFMGDRVGGSLDASFRFTGSFRGDAFGLFTFDVDASDMVTGVAYTIGSFDEQGFIVDEFIGIQGSVSNGTLTATTEDGDGMIAGSLNKTTGTLSGTWSDMEGAAGTFSGTGCKLN